MRRGLRLCHRRYWRCFQPAWSGLQLQQFVASDSKYSFALDTSVFLYDSAVCQEHAEAGPGRAGVGPGPEPGAARSRATTQEPGRRLWIARATIGIDRSGGTWSRSASAMLGGSGINEDRRAGSYADYRFRAPNLLLFEGWFEHSICRPSRAAILADSRPREISTAQTIGSDHSGTVMPTGIPLGPGGFSGVASV